MYIAEKTRYENMKYNRCGASGLALDSLYNTYQVTGLPLGPICAPSADAINAALKATNYGIAPKLEGDIKQIVPPILKMSRKLQQDPEYLKTHPWFAYLKPLPKADQMWEGNKKIQ